MPDLVKYKHFITYLISKLKRTSLYGITRRTVTYFRRFFLIGRIIKWISVIFTVIETGAILLSTAAVILLLLPIGILTVIGFYIAELTVGGRILQSAELRADLEKERIFVIDGADTFGEGMARELQEHGAAVFIITASLNKKFVGAKRLDGVYYIRHSFFFRLKKRRLTELSDKLIYLM